jgi:hypothetical protein
VVYCESFQFRFSLQEQLVEELTSPLLDQTIDSSPEIPVTLHSHGQSGLLPDLDAI